MVLFNYSTKEITAKIVYYGPGLCGKTTNLQHIHSKLDPSDRGKLLSLATETDRTLFFDFLPLDLGKIGGFHARFQLYTVPGQVHYNATRRMVLKGVDAVVFVADSQLAMLEHNRESFENLAENLRENGSKIEKIPFVVQLNKRDLPNVAAPGKILEAMGAEDAPWFEAVATTGQGVFETLKAIVKLAVGKLKTEFNEESVEEPDIGAFEEKPPPREPEGPQPLFSPDTPMVEQGADSVASAGAPPVEAEPEPVTAGAGDGLMDLENEAVYGEKAGERGSPLADEEIEEVPLEDEISIDGGVDVFGEDIDLEEQDEETPAAAEEPLPPAAEGSPAPQAPAAVPEAAGKGELEELRGQIAGLEEEVVRLREDNSEIRESLAGIFKGLREQVEILRRMSEGNEKEGQR